MANTRARMTAKEKALHRVRIIQGHVRAIEKMLEDDQYCMDVLHQSLAVQKALRKMDQELLRNHLDHCVVRQIREGQEKKAAEELLKLYELK
jgi:DNA-binding FrmR family transcriptional regulator